jgi:hypothetical protein
MKKLFLTIILFFSLIEITQAASTLYLKCPKIITENRSVGLIVAVPDNEDWPYNVGKKINTMFAEIKLNKSEATITPYHYDYLKLIEPLLDKKDPGKLISAKLLWEKGQSKKFKVKKESDDSYTIDQSYKMMGVPTDQANEITKMIWFNKNDEWFYKDLLYIKYNGKETKVKTESKCDLIAKEEFKNYLKNGEGLDFFNY